MSNQSKRLPNFPSKFEMCNDFSSIFNFARFKLNPLVEIEEEILFYVKELLEKEFNRLLKGD